MRGLFFVLSAAFCFAAADSAWIVEKGGVLTRDKAGKVIGVDLRASWVTDSDIADLAAMSEVKVPRVVR